MPGFMKIFTIETPGVYASAAGFLKTESFYRCSIYRFAGTQRKLKALVYFDYSRNIVVFHKNLYYTCDYGSDKR
jgi:hypothetical protein